MPDIEDLSYDRDETITAVRDYYAFLVSMYLDPSCIVSPPEGGWPSITADSLSGLGKTEEVINLLKHLPYIAVHSDESLVVQGGPRAVFADWRRDAELAASSGDAEEFKSASEGVQRTKHVPPSVIGLTSGGNNNTVLLLDTVHGVVYWPDCPGEEHKYGTGEPFEPAQERVSDDPYDWCETEEEAMWRDEGGAWPVKEFFEMWKDQFRELRFVPVGRGSQVKDAYTTYHPSLDGLIEMLRGIYREHGWPDLATYRKEECMQAIQRALKERYPVLAAAE